MTLLQLAELVNAQLSRLEAEPVFILEAQFSSSRKELSYTCYYYPKDLKFEAVLTHFKQSGYATSAQLLLGLSESIDNFLRGTKEDITID